MNSWEGGVRRQDAKMDEHRGGCAASFEHEKRRVARFKEAPSDKRAGRAATLPDAVDSHVFCYGILSLFVRDACGTALPSIPAILL